MVRTLGERRKGDALKGRELHTQLYPADFWHDSCLKHLRFNPSKPPLTTPAERRRVDSANLIAGVPASASGRLPNTTAINLGKGAASRARRIGRDFSALCGQIRNGPAPPAGNQTRCEITTMQDKTTIALTIDEDLGDDLKDVIKFILFARRLDLGDQFDFNSDEALEMAVIVSIQTASRLADVVTHNASECENQIKDFLGYDPFFNDDGEEIEGKELARKLGLTIRRRPKLAARAKKVAHARGSDRTCSAGKLGCFVATACDGRLGAVLRGSAGHCSGISYQPSRRLPKYGC